LGNLRQKYHFEGLVVAGRIVLKWILQKWVFGSGTELMGLSMVTVGRALVDAVLNLLVP
jgi:hypothetical protein